MKEEIKEKIIEILKNLPEIMIIGKYDKLGHYGKIVEGKWILDLTDQILELFEEEKKKWIREEQDKINKEYFPKSLPKGRYVINP